MNFLGVRLIPVRHLPFSLRGYWTHLDASKGCGCLRVLLCSCSSVCIHCLCHVQSPNVRDGVLLPSASLSAASAPLCLSPLTPLLSLVLSPLQPQHFYSHFCPSSIFHPDCLSLFSFLRVLSILSLLAPDEEDTRGP